MAKRAPCIVWFRDDLRLSDHPALSEAVASGASVICLYILDETSPEFIAGAGRAHGAATRWWLAQSLKALSGSLPDGQDLVLRRGPASEVLAAIAGETGAKRVYWNEIPIPAYGAVADRVRQTLERLGIEAHQCRGDLLAHPSKLRTVEGRGLRVFTPFWRRILTSGDPPKPLPKPRLLKNGIAVASDTVVDWKLEPSHPDWAGGLRETCRPGEQSAQKTLQDFLSDGIKGYATLRDRPDREAATSRLSPHLRFGEISPRQVWYAARFAAAEHPHLTSDIDKFLAELGWREFCRHLLFDHPKLATENLQHAFNRFPWRKDNKQLVAWQRGQTGYPIVDAGMRELWHTGVMHNRVRMVVASFLVKHLLIDWRDGEQWFWDTLVDADPGSNPANWQWVAGSGADAAPYFRIFNPTLQGEKFDPDGTYVRRWVPELAQVATKYIHSPWTATPLELEAVDVKLGQTYPEPIVDHKAARARALAALAKTKG